MISCKIILYPSYLLKYLKIILFTNFLLFFISALIDKSGFYAIVSFQLSSKACEEKGKNIVW